MGKIIADVQLVTPGEAVRRVSVSLTDTGEIGDIIEASDTKAGDEILFDGGGELTLWPGFIDIHTHGAKGFDLSNATLEAVETMAEAKLAEGVTTFLPTTWTASQEQKLNMARAAGAYQKNQRFARAPYLHIEGPYLNPDQAGAQDPSYMRPPSVDEILEIHEICPVRLVSLAVELEGALEFIRKMSDTGIVTSAAHSAATFAEFQAARKAGLQHLTHYCNQMSRLHHREVGLVGAGLLDDEVYIEMICDKIHLCPDMIQLVFKHRSCDRIILITDSIAASHLGDGEYPLGDTKIIVRDGEARIPEGNLAGSIAKYNEVVRNVYELTNQPLSEIAKSSSANQARSLGLHDRGTIQEGKLADLTLLDADFSPQAVFVGGEIRYSKN